jgi:hypothetical protein
MVIVKETSLREELFQVHDSITRFPIDNNDCERFTRVVKGSVYDYPFNASVAMSIYLLKTSPQGT